MDRREFLYGLNTSLGSIAMTAMLAADDVLAQDAEAKAPHFPEAKAKHCIFLYMEGGPSHIDTFDPKPKLKALHEQEFQRKGPEQSAMASGKRYYVQSPFEFKKAGESGADITTAWPHLTKVVDDICFYRGLQVTSVNHPAANYHVNTGNRFGGDPAIGSWVNLGLGTGNQDLPGFVVLPELSFPQGGPANWNNGFLPTDYQGTAFRSEGTPVLNLRPTIEKARSVRSGKLDLLRSLNAGHKQRHPRELDLDARITNLELAARMQLAATEAMDITRETSATHAMYGIDKGVTASYGKRCLMARRLVERGVRYVQIMMKGQPWDTHTSNVANTKSCCAQTDQPVGALLADLQQRGMLDSTLVLWGGEFGRTPGAELRGNAAKRGNEGRDHHPYGYSVWMAGGGIKGGQTYGETDDFGYRSVVNRTKLSDYHATVLHLLGLDHEKLDHEHNGRSEKLTDVYEAQVIKQLLA